MIHFVYSSEEETGSEHEKKDKFGVMTMYFKEFRGCFTAKGNKCTKVIFACL